MPDDPYELFTRCHRLFVQGVRRAFRERLGEAYGEGWWDVAVWPALTENQQESLRVGIERERRADKADYLDSLQFANVIIRNHAAVFTNAFPDIDHAIRLFRVVAHTRNEWAHVPPEGMDAEKVRAAINAMISLLVSLSCREALELDKMINHESEELAKTNSGTSAGEPDPPGDLEMNEITESPLGLWRELQSYLTLDSTVIEETDGRIPQTRVSVRVSNVAPISEGRPEVYFKEVHLSVNSQRGQKSMTLGRLQPGQVIEQEFSFNPKELASVVFEVKGDLDYDRFFRLNRSTGLPASVVTPLIQEFVQRFADIRINEPLSEALTAVQAVGPEMTLAVAGQVRQDLQRAHLIAEKEASLQSLFRDYHLNKQTRLGAHCHQVWLLLREVGTRIQAVDSAIEGTDPRAAAEAVRSLEELQLAILQVEETTRTMST